MLLLKRLGNGKFEKKLKCPILKEIKEENLKHTRCPILKEIREANLKNTRVVGDWWESE